MKPWVEQVDWFSEFLDSLALLGLRRSPGRIKRIDLWEVFNGWMENSPIESPRLSKREFYRELERAGFKVSRVEGAHVVWGIEWNRTESQPTGTLF